MKIAVLGATGRTGELAITRALARGHEVRALTRGAAAAEREGLSFHAGDIRDAEAVASVVAGADAVISAVGARGRDADLHTTLAAHTIAAMKQAGVSRFVGISVAGLTLPGDQKGPRDRVIGALARALAGAATADRQREVEAWQASDLEWTLIRVPRLVDGAAKGTTQPDASVVDEHTPPRGITLRRDSLAALLVDFATTDHLAGQAPFAADN